MARLDRIFRRGNMKHQIVSCIHDSIWMEGAMDEEPEVLKLMAKVMTEEGQLGVPLEIDFN
jgi:DNA polymerase I-like protein with 3'-5' exonuclease and polymerase domains